MFLWLIVLSAIVAELNMSFWWCVLLALGYFWYTISNAGNAGKEADKK